MTRSQAIGYLAAMIDGEGSVSVAKVGLKKGQPHGKRSIRIANTEESIIAACCEVLDILEVPHYVVRCERRQQAHHKPYSEVTITQRDALEWILANIPIRSLAKRERLAEAISNYAWRKPIPPDELRRLYVDERQSLQQIGDVAGVTATTVHRWMCLAGIKRRPRPGWEPILAQRPSETASTSAS